MSGIFRGNPGADLDPRLDVIPNTIINCRELNVFDVNG